MSEHKEGSAEYKGVKKISTPNGNGYPVEVPRKTKTVRGAGCAVRGKKISDRMG